MVNSYMYMTTHESSTHVHYYVHKILKDNIHVHTHLWEYFFHKLKKNMKGSYSRKHIICTRMARTMKLF